MTDSNSVMKTTETVHANAGKAISVTIRGRIESSRMHEGTCYTRILTPSVDAYSHPQLVEIRSSRVLGETDDEVVCDCTLTGYKRTSYEFKSKRSRKIIKVISIEHALTFPDVA